MLKAEEVEPFDDEEKKSIAEWEKAIDEQLRTKKGWFHRYTVKQRPKEFAYLARQYRAAGWHVVVILSKAQGDWVYEIMIRHPAITLPPEVVQPEQALA